MPRLPDDIWFHMFRYMRRKFAHRLVTILKLSEKNHMTKDPIPVTDLAGLFNTDFDLDPPATDADAAATCVRKPKTKTSFDHLKLTVDM